MSGGLESAVANPPDPGGPMSGPGGGKGGVGGQGGGMPGIPGGSEAVDAPPGKGGVGGVGNQGFGMPTTPGGSEAVDVPGSGKTVLIIGVGILILLIVIGLGVVGSGVLGKDDAVNIPPGNGNSNSGISPVPGQCYSACDPAASNCAEGLACAPRADGTHICFNEFTCGAVAQPQGDEGAQGVPGLPSSGCECQGSTLVCADGSIGEFNPQCTGGETSCSCQGSDLHCSDGTVVSCSDQCGCLKP
jgi:hypothetical protein